MQVSDTAGRCDRNLRGDGGGSIIINLFRDCGPKWARADSNLTENRNQTKEFKPRQQDAAAASEQRFGCWIGWIRNNGASCAFNWGARGLMTRKKSHVRLPSSPHPQKSAAFCTVLSFQGEKRVSIGRGGFYFRFCNDYKRGQSTPPPKKKMKERKEGRDKRGRRRRERQKMCIRKELQPGGKENSSTEGAEKA